MQQQSPTQSEFERELAEYCSEAPPDRNDPSQGSAREVGEEESRRTSMVISGGDV